MVEEGSVAFAPEIRVREMPAPRPLDPRDAWPEGETETGRVLLAMAHRKTGRFPGELLVKHVLAITAGGDWPLRRGAMEAVLRRCESVQEGRFHIQARRKSSRPRRRVHRAAKGWRRAAVRDSRRMRRSARGELRLRRLPPQLTWALQ